MTTCAHTYQGMFSLSYVIYSKHWMQRPGFSYSEGFGNARHRAHVEGNTPNAVVRIASHTSPASPHADSRGLRRLQCASVPQRRERQTRRAKDVEWDEGVRNI